MSEERLQKVLAQAGVGYGHACEELIKAGRVTVDGRIVTELGCYTWTQILPTSGWMPSRSPPKSTATSSSTSRWDICRAQPPRRIPLLGGAGEGVGAAVRRGPAGSGQRRAAAADQRRRTRRAADASPLRARQDLPGASTGLSQPAQGAAVATRRHVGGRPDVAGACGAVARAAPRHRTGGSCDGEAAEHGAAGSRRQGPAGRSQDGVDELAQSDAAGGPEAPVAAHGRPVGPPHAARDSDRAGSPDVGGSAARQVA